VYNNEGANPGNSKADSDGFHKTKVSWLSLKKRALCPSAQTSCVRPRDAEQVIRYARVQLREFALGILIPNDGRAKMPSLGRVDSQIHFGSTFVVKD
jgi:hypothetical protein